MDNSTQQNKNSLLFSIAFKDFSLWVLLLALAAFYYLFFIRYYELPCIRSDGMGYYSYLPSFLLYHDPSFATLAEKLDFYGYPGTDGNTLPNWLGVHSLGTPGKVTNQYNIGVALLLLPFFTIGHLLTLLTGRAADGLTLWYQICIGSAGCFYFAAGVEFLRRALLRIASPGATLWALLAVVFGSNVFHYGTMDALFSHIFLFFLFAWLIWLTPLWHHKKNLKNSLALALIAGMLFLVRTPALLALLIPLLYGVNQNKEWRQKVYDQLVHFKSIFAFATLFGVLVFLQVLTWKITSGSWLIYPYGEVQQQLVFSKPQIGFTLFSVRRGFIFWTPMALLALGGCFALYKHRREWFWPVIAFLLFNTYIISCWNVIVYGGGFGHRAFVESWTLLALPLACLFETTQKNWWGRILRAITLLLIAQALFLTWMYWEHKISIFGMAWHEYLNLYRFW